MTQDHQGRAMKRIVRVETITDWGKSIPSSSAILRALSHYGSGSHVDRYAKYAYVASP